MALENWAVHVELTGAIPGRSQLRTRGIGDGRRVGIDGRQRLGRPPDRKFVRAYKVRQRRKWDAVDCIVLLSPRHVEQTVELVRILEIAIMLAGFWTVHDDVFSAQSLQFAHGV